jgi:hypothetical protein
MSQTRYSKPAGAGSNWEMAAEDAIARIDTWNADRKVPDWDHIRLARMKLANGGYFPWEMDESRAILESARRQKIIA